MKITELTFMNLNKPAFNDDDDLKDKITNSIDLVINAYKKSENNKFGVTDFSNEIAQSIKDYTVKYMAKKYKINSEQELAKLKDTINNTISLHYIEYKLNGVIY